MPIYIVTDNQTGKTFKLSGDKPPTQSDVQEAAQMLGYDQSQQQQPQPQQQNQNIIDKFFSNPIINTPMDMWNTGSYFMAGGIDGLDRTMRGEAGILEPIMSGVQNVQKGYSSTNPEDERTISQAFPEFLDMDPNSLPGIVTGFAGEIFLDPFTYLSFGSSIAGKADEFIEAFKIGRISAQDAAQAINNINKSGADLIIKYADPATGAPRVLKTDSAKELSGFLNSVKEYGKNIFFKSYDLNGTDMKNIAKNVLGVDGRNLKTADLKDLVIDFIQKNDIPSFRTRAGAKRIDDMAESTMRSYENAFFDQTKGKKIDPSELGQSLFNKTKEFWDDINPSSAEEAFKNKVANEGIRSIKASEAGKRYTPDQWLKAKRKYQDMSKAAIQRGDDFNLGKVMSDAFIDATDRIAPGTKDIGVKMKKMINLKDIASPKYNKSGGYTLFNSFKGPFSGGALGLAASGLNPIAGLVGAVAGSIPNDPRVQKVVGSGIMKAADKLGSIKAPTLKSAISNVSKSKNKVAAVGNAIKAAGNTFKGLFTNKDDKKKNKKNTSYRY